MGVMRLIDGCRFAWQEGWRMRARRAGHQSCWLATGYLELGEEQMGLVAVTLFERASLYSWRGVLLVDMQHYLCQSLCERTGCSHQYFYVSVHEDFHCYVQSLSAGEPFPCDTLTNNASLAS